MRWPFRRKANGSQGRAESVDAPVVRPSGRAWATMPPLPLVVRPVAPLVVGPAPVVPPLAAGREKPVTKGVAPVGVVVGLAVPVVRVPEPAPVGVAPVLPAVVVRRATRELPATVPTLVEAGPEFVGEPREPAQPHRAPGWLRFAPSWATPAEPETPISEPPSFLPPALRTPAPPRMEEAVRLPELPQTPMRKRRPNLGESRRLGLGAPISREDMVDSPIQESSQGTTPEPTAPAEPQPPPPPEEPLPPPAAPRGEPGQPVYRAASAPPLVERQKSLPKSLPKATVVPPELAHAVRNRQRVDVSDVPVYRGSTVDQAAKAKGARAFASGGAVFLPDAAGPVSEPKARGLLAHELVHTVQQRVLGTRLPPPDSPLGQALEAEAQAAERYYGGEPGAPEPPPLVHAPAPVAAAEPDLTAPAQHAPVQPAPVITRPEPQEPPPMHPVTRAEVGRIAEESAKHVVEEWTNPALARNDKPVVDRETRRQQMIAETLETVNYERAVEGKAPLTILDEAQQQRIERRLDGDGSGGASVVPPPRQFAPNSKNAWLQGLTGHDPTRGLNLGGMTAPAGSEESWFASEDTRPFKERLLGGLGMAGFTEQFKPANWMEPATAPAATGADRRPTTPEKQQTSPAAEEKRPTQAQAADAGEIDLDRLDLDVLSERIYDRLRRRLRLELLVDRERAGLLTDFR